MSLVIQKFEPGGKTTQPRLYKRGNDDIDLDAYIRDAESEFSYWLANSRLKDKEKQQVQEAYSKMLQGINDGTFTYKIGGGYNNSIGMSNKVKGFDAAGLAAGFLGNILRNQSVYKAAEEKPDPSKIEWKGNASVGSALVRHLYGSDKESLNDFIDLDPYDIKIKKRGNTNRSGRFKSGLEYIRDNFDNLFTSFTDSDKATALERINLALSAFDNGTVEDNEYLDLGRATGMSNLRDMFFAGEGYSSTPDKAAPGTVAPGADNTGVYTNEDEWRASTHPRTTLTKLLNRSLHPNTKYSYNDRVKLGLALNSLSLKQLLSILRTGLLKTREGKELNNIAEIVKIFGGTPNFENDFIVRNVVELCKRKNYLHLFDSNSNYYYIPIESKTFDERGTGLVYSIEGDRSIQEFDRNDIPYFTNLWHNDWLKQVPSNKNGGLLRKFKIGGSSNIYFNDGLDYGYNTYLNSIFSKENVIESLKNLFQGDNALSDYEKYVLNNVDTRHTAGINDYLNGKTYTGNDAVKAFNTGYLNNGNTFNYALFGNSDEDYNNRVNAALYGDNRFHRVSNPSGTGDRYNADPTKAYIDNALGALTYSRVASFTNPDMQAGLFGEWGNYWKSLGATGAYYYTDESGKGQWIPTTDTSKNKYIAFEDPVAARKAVVASTTSPDAVSADELFGKTPTEEHTDAWKRVFGLNAGSDSVDEKYFPAVDITPKNGSFGSFMADLAPDLIGAGRLWASLHTNNRVYNAILLSLKPVLKDTYERYSPVTGAFSARQLKDKQGADVMRQSNQAFTSDASLAAARMLEGLRQANLLQAEGFLADDQEIRRTQAEALARLEDNMARRSDVANFNRASINLTNRERAQLKATRLKSNWQSWDNFLQGFESRIRTRMDENRERANNFYDKLSANQAEEWYNTVMEPANRALDAWSKSDKGRNADITEWEDWNYYIKHKLRARAMANAMIYQNMADRYKLSYNNPYTQESYSLLNWNRRYV